MRVLVLYHAGFTYTPTIVHYLQAMRAHSRHEVEYFNVDDGYGVDLSFAGYDAVFVNFCVASMARVPEPPRFMPWLILALRRFDGIKIAAVQDEYDFTNAVKRFFQEIGANVILTNVPQPAVRLVYPEPAFDAVRFETVQTAYLADDLLSVESEPLAARPIVLGYRGRILPYRVGDLGWHKSEVGLRFRAACAARDIPCDIEVDEGSRFAGPAWLEFVRRCRVMLGSPSGANVFDFDGLLHQRMLERYWSAPAAWSYEEVRAEIAAHEVGFDMGQVSARIFEAVASRTALALVRGSYSGVIEPDEHYVPIEPDYSNVVEALDRIQDTAAMQAMADRAFAHVIPNPAHRYSGMVARLDALVDEAVTQPRPTASCGVCSTKAPLGADSYLLERLKVLSVQLGEVMTAAAEGRQVAVTQLPEGQFQILQLMRAQAG